MIRKIKNGLIHIGMTVLTCIGFIRISYFAVKSYMDLSNDVVFEYFINIIAYSLTAICLFFFIVKLFLLFLRREVHNEN